MSRCTAPVNGHRSASAAAKCPECSGRSRYQFYSQPYVPSFSNSTRSSGLNRSSQSRSSASWSKGSSVLYTPAQIRTLTPVRKSFEKRAEVPDLRDIFLCHAWDDRKGVAKELYDLLEAKGVNVWFSENDVLLGSSLLREIDKGLANSRVGIVLVTPSFLKRIKGEGVADKELSALLARDLLVPIVHETNFDALREVSPLLGSRSGLSTEEESIEEVVDKLSELVALD
ncbi:MULTISPECIES: toll/interleukin-1 receptor domain-containing protein [Lactococcus]|uniref:toll/interleukin-1 receptor domain-containing protein n=1 Tax=Lactococcus TaxID=1357 RepID=UPI001A8E2782|nr:toll/interleukin-1 receptor domain-containing protein [Lactococcus sp. LG592]QSR09936.1 toll/interleukin-1 receptor domain-containing protein [Lactococcus sp. LG592]